MLGAEQLLHCADCGEEITSEEFAQLTTLKQRYLPIEAWNHILWLCPACFKVRWESTRHRRRTRGWE
jgi:hypothetical protein